MEQQQQRQQGEADAKKERRRTHPEPRTDGVGGGRWPRHEREIDCTARPRPKGPANDVSAGQAARHGEP